MTALFDHDQAWRGLSIPEKRVLRNKLSERLAKAGEVPNRQPSPLDLWRRHDPTQIRRPHLDAINDGLVGLKHFRETGCGYRKLMVISAPQIGKSTTTTRAFPKWWLTESPTERLGIFSYAASLAAVHSAAIRNSLEMHGAEHGLFMSHDEATRSDWTLTTGGGLRARGVGSGISGHPISAGVIDDPYKDRAGADSPIMRAHVWEWYSSAYITRLTPDAVTVLTMTRWHQKDLAGELLKRDGWYGEGGEWEVVFLPAISTGPDTVDLDRGIFPDSLGRPVGEPLTHPLIAVGDLTALQKHWAGRKRDSTVRDWNALYQCAPVAAEGALLNETQIANATTPVTGTVRRVAVGVDPSGGGRDSAGIVAGVVNDVGHAWITHDRTAVMDVDVWPMEVCRLAHEVDATRIVFESNYGGDMAKSLITQAWEKLQRDDEIPDRALCPLVVGVNARKSKVLRAEPIAQAIQVGRAFFARTDRPAGVDLAGLCSEWTMWEPGSVWSPGALDASVHLLTELLPRVGAGVVTGSAAGRSKSKPAGKTGGVAGRRITRR